MLVKRGVAIQDYRQNNMFCNGWQFSYITQVQLLFHYLLTTQWPVRTVQFGHKPVQCCPEPWTLHLGVCC